MAYAAAHHGGAAWDCVSRDVIDADVLDAWFDPCPGVVSLLQDRAGWVARTSPPADGSIAQRSICQARGVDPSTVVLGAGSSDLIYRAMLRLISPIDQVLVLDPGYSEYPHLLANVIGCSVRAHRIEGPRFQIDLERLRQDAEECRWVVLANPNNPAGAYLSRHDLLQFVGDLPADTWLWLDEAYLEYVEGAESLERDVAGRNLIVLRSLSKTLALSGLRAAYLTASAQIAQALRSITPPWVMGLPAQLAVREALSAPEYYWARYRETAVLRSSLSAGLSPFQVVEGAANWALILPSQDGPTAAEVSTRCAAQGLFVRDASRTSQALGDRAVRIAVKEAAANERIVAILRSVLS